jgi:sRNA-binding protein
MSAQDHAKQNLKKLQEYCFEHKLRVPWNKVLAIGIYQDLKQVLPNDLMTSRELFRALGHHVNSPSYLKRVSVGAQRYGLKYTLASRVTIGEAMIAKAQFFKLHAAHRKAQKSKAKIAHKSKKHLIPGGPT